MNIPIENIYFILCYAWDKLKEKNIVNVDARDITDLRNLFARILISGTSYLLKRGLDRGYIPISEDTRCIRGRIDFNISLKRLIFPNAKAHCLYDEISYDVLHNQILKSTIHLLIDEPEVDKDLRGNLINLSKRLAEIQRIELKARAFRKVRLNRNNMFYDFLLRICELIVDSILPTEDPGERKFRSLLENNMPKVFESFVRNFYKHHYPEYQPKAMTLMWQNVMAAQEAKDYLPQLVTDVSLIIGDRIVVIDTKYYKECLQQHFDKSTIHSAHLFQIYSYLINIHTLYSGERNCHGILLYPTVLDDIELCYNIMGFPISVVTLNLNQHWQNIEEDLKDLLHKPCHSFT